MRLEVETLAKVLGLNLQLESHTEEGVVRGDESESELRGVDIEGSSSREQLQQQQDRFQPDSLNSFARQLEEQLSSCHREKPLDLEPSDLEVDDENEMANLQAEKPFESKESLGGKSCQECSAVLPSGLFEAQIAHL